MTTLRLPVRGPFSLAASTRFLEGFAPARYRGSPDGGPLRLTFPVEGSGGTVGVAVRQDADGGVLADVGPVLPDRGAAGGGPRGGGRPSPPGGARTPPPRPPPPGGRGRGFPDGRCRGPGGGRA